jgi:murein DD-endopeptidase MepM/ murein hydrolase activator NlpD
MAQTLRDRLRSITNKNKTATQPNNASRSKTLQANNRLFKAIDSSKKKEEPRSLALQPNSRKFDNKTFNYKPIQREQQLPNPGVSKVNPIQEIKPQSTGFTPPEDFFSLAAKQRLNPGSLTEMESQQLNQYSQQMYADQLRKQFSGTTEGTAGEQAQSGFLSTLERQIQEQQDELKRKERELRNQERDKLVEFERNLQRKYQPQMDAVRESGERRKTDTKNVLSFQGFGRSSLAIREIDDINKSTEQAQAAVNAAMAAELDIYRAQLAGATGEQLQPMYENLNNLRQTAKTAELEQAALMEEARMKAEASGDNATLEMLQGLQTQAMQQQEVDTKASELAGYFVDSFGQPVLDPEGNRISVAQDGNFQLIQGENPLTGQPVVAGIFDKNTGQVVASGMSQGMAQTPQLSGGTPTEGVVGIVPGGTISGYGSRAWKHGLDIAAPKGTPVRIPQGGQVIEVKTGVPDTPPEQGKGFGNQVKIRFADGRQGWFSHLDQVAPLQEGQVLPEGAQIGTIGRTGYTYGKNGYHLDLTMKDVNGNFISPREVEQYISQPTMSQNVDNSLFLAAQARDAGYNDKFGIQQYVQAAQQGVFLPNRNTQELQQFIEKERAKAELMPNADQLKAGEFAGRMSNASSYVSGIENKLADLNYAEFYSLKAVPNFAKPSWYQQYEQSQREFINAVLRRESGAAIAESEFDSAEKQYFPQPGDSPEVIARKRMSRENAIQSMANTSQRQLTGLPSFSAQSVTPTQEPEQSVDQYREKLSKLKGLGVDLSQIQDKNEMLHILQNLTP